ncbi:hypothetical protein FGE12_07575 [Aggregicoccus sp. 17bor-14]|uniref:hypothetical protein n=1 Tax=Myxococcaceae TaxID=31 RepID=UPI00129D1055|nr:MULTISPECIES: hypothetical protein [Myxococcaceae]MBF5042253.1 hypothetical protein [Simulacricoccus sp. 17bor-14]MRI88028.1 hypothetical protein [Aggregicoccus sp. 17bor-14]
MSGSGQTGRIGEALAEPLVARLVDERDEPIAGQTISFVVTSGGGSAFAGAGTTNSDGYVRERWTLGMTTAEPQKVEARMVDSGTGEARVLAEFTATALPGPAVGLRVAPSSPSTGPAGGTATLAVEVLDAHGNRVPDVQVGWERVTADATPAAATSVSGADGVARMDWALSGTIGTAGAAATLGQVRASLSISIMPGPGVRFEHVVTELVGGAPGGKPAVAPNFRVFDAFGHATSTDVTLTVLEGGGHLALEGNPTRATVRTTSLGWLVEDACVPGSCNPLQGNSYWVLGPTPGRNVLAATLANGEEIRFTTYAQAPMAAFARRDDGQPNGWIDWERDVLTFRVHACQTDTSFRRTLQVGDRISEIVFRQGIPYFDAPVHLEATPCHWVAQVDVTGLPPPWTVTLRAEDAGNASSTETVKVARCTDNRIQLCPVP